MVTEQAAQTVWWPLFSSYAGDETATLLLCRELGSFGKEVTIVNVYATPTNKPEFIEPLVRGVKPTPKLLAAAAVLVSFFKSDIPDQ